MLGKDIDPAFRETESRKSLALIEILEDNLGATVGDALVVGCGTGREAGLIARKFQSTTIGIDIGGDFAFDQIGSAPAKLMIMDARKLMFPSETFDLVYSFHALEHIPNPEKALAEMARVLRPGGTYLIGTPNKDRLIGYIGSAASFKDKLLWNWADFKQRIKGQWSNEAGAHAGFTRTELSDLCGKAFGSRSIHISDHYYSKLYGRLASGLKLARLSSVVYPCVYVMGKKA